MKNIHRIATSLIIVMFFSTAIILTSLFLNRAEYLWTPRLVFLLVVVPLAFMACLSFVLTRGAGLRLNFCIALLGGAAALYVAELALILAGPYITLPSDFDRRTKLEVVLDLRERGLPAVPSVHPKNILRVPFKVRRQEILPLGGIPRATTVFCNEIGEYYIYESDEFGFTNPTGLYNPGTEIALIGDSFTQGFCAPNGTSYAELLRSYSPNVLNLGNNGNGPLVELASLREFAADLKPNHVFWFYFEGNDIEDLSRELRHPVLRKYLESPEYRQKLVDLVPEYDSALREFVETGIEQEQKRGAAEKIVSELPHKFKLWFKLWHIRALLGLTDIKREWPLRRWESGVSEEEVAAAFGDVMRQANQEVKAWGGELVFVYLPSYRTYGYKISHPWRERVLEVVKGAGIPLIDFNEIFARQPDPVGLYNYRKEGHYTAEGNNLVAEVVVKYLQNAPQKQPV